MNMKYSIRISGIKNDLFLGLNDKNTITLFKFDDDGVCVVLAEFEVLLLRSLLREFDWRATLKNSAKRSK